MEPLPLNTLSFPGNIMKPHIVSVGLKLPMEIGHH